MVTKMAIKNQGVIPKKQLQKFEEYAAKIEKDDEVFDSAKKSSKFLKKRGRYLFCSFRDS